MVKKNFNIFNILAQFNNWAKKGQLNMLDETFPKVYFTYPFGKDPNENIWKEEGPFKVTGR